MTLSVKRATSFARDALALVLLFVAVASVCVDSSVAGGRQAAPASGGAAQHRYDSAATSTTSPGALGAGAAFVYDSLRQPSPAHVCASARSVAAKARPRIAGGAPKPEEIIRPGGQLIGQPGRRAGIREVDDAGVVDDLFEQIRIHGTPAKSRYPGEGYDLPGGGFVGRRVSTKHGPTLDVNLPGGDDIFKVHVRR